MAIRVTIWHEYRHEKTRPNVREMYPDGMAGQTLVSVPGVSEGLCGGSRPSANDDGHDQNEN